MRYLSHTPSNIADMLQVIGKPSLENLFDSIPTANRLNRLLDLPKALSEIELKVLLEQRASHAPKLSFLGAGACTHHVPEFVSQMLLRGEWLTAYTPYQPEVSQGTLQAIFEFQTIVAGLFGLEIANASMYDGATALAEACLMACRLKPGIQCVFIPKTVHPEYREVSQTILGAARIKITDQPGDSVAAVVYQNPNFFGQLKNQAQIIKQAHAKNALVIAVCTDPVALGAISSPGSLGADIAVGEGIGLCGHLSLGAPGVGLFATKKEFLRQMPGRLCGQTVDSKGQRGFVLTLSTREQHIRREKATSNICTNHNLMALAFTITLSLYGKSGFRELAYQNIKKAIYLREQAQKAGLKILFDGPHFNELVLELTDSQVQAVKRLKEQDIFAGVFLERWYPEHKNCLLIATTELHTEDAIDNLIRSLT